MKGLLIWGLILTTIAYGSFKGVAWYQVSRLMLKVKSVTESHLALRYGWIGTSLTGEVTIHDVEVTPYQIRKPLYAEKVVIRFDSVLDIINSFPLFEQSQHFNLPTQLELEWQDVLLPLSEGWGVYLPATDQQKKLFGLACGRTELIGLSELQSMGYDHIPHDFRLAWNYDARTQLLRTDAELELEDLGMKSIQIELKLAHGWQWPPPEDVIPPKLNDLVIAFDDKSFIRRVTLLCGKQGNYNQQEFVDASVVKTRNIFAKAGVSISQPLLDAYATFLEGDGIFEVYFEPAQPVDLSALPSLSANEIASQLNPMVKVNRVLIPGAEFLVDAGQLTRYLFPPPEPERPPEKPKKRERPASFQQVGLDSIDRFINSKVKLQLRNGKDIEGVLKAVEYNRIDIDVPQRSGSLLLHYDRFDVRQLWVLSNANLASLRPPAPPEAVKKPSAPAAPAGEPVRQQLSEVLDNINTENTTIIYEDGVDMDTPLAEGEYFEIIEIEPAPQIVNPTINDLPAADAEKN